jgi:hypothetical protein
VNFNLILIITIDFLILIGIITFDAAIILSKLKKIESYLKSPDEYFTKYR